LVLAVAASLFLRVIAATLFGVRDDQSARDAHDAADLAERRRREADEQLWRGMVNEAPGIRLSGRRGQRFEALAKLRQALDLARRQGELATADKDRFRAEATACLMLP